MGIANIINTAGGGGGGGSEIITNLVNSVDGAGLRLANQGYISCAHVSANKFGTNDFSVEFVLSQETSAINADIFISNLNGSNQAVDAAVIRWDVIQNDNIQLVFTNSGASETAYNFGYDPAPDLNEPTHYLVSADRSGNAVLYRNGAEIASISIAASGSANVGNSGQPTVIGSPVNNFGVKGNVYRLRTYSKALSSDEAKNVFDRADVPTALVSNLLLDLDCAYANPTQSTVIQDRGPNNQDGTLNGTITQTNVIKQLNSTSARIGTTAATPADGQVIGDKITTTNAIQLERVSEYTAKLSCVDSGGNQTLQILGNRAAGSGSSGTDVLIGGQQSRTTGNVLRVDQGSDTYLTIDSSGQVGLSATPNLGSSNANNTILTLKGKAAAYGGIIEMSNHGTSGNGQTLGAISYFDPATATTKNAEIEVLRESADDDAKMVFKTKPTGGTLADRLTISSTGHVSMTSSDAAAQLTITPTGANANGIVNFIPPGTGRAIFQYGGTEAISFNNSGVTFSNGIAFQSATTGSGTGVGYTLDSYETGTWTPVIADASSGGNTGSGTTVQGYYTRIGNKVTVSGICTNINTSGMTASNDLFIRGLPFQSGYASGTNANLGRASGSCVLDQFNIDSSCYGVVPMVFAGNTYFQLMEMQDANNDDIVLVSEVSSTYADLFFTITYFV